MRPRGVNTLRIALIGWGAIGHTVGEKLADSPVEIVAIGVRDKTRARRDIPAGTQIIDRPEQLVDLGLDVVAEAAGRESVGLWGRASLAAGTDFIVSSASAFADAALLEELRGIASTQNTQIHIQPGALAGVDALSAARRMGIDSVQHRIVKPPRAWAGTPAAEMCELDALDGPFAFFTANATETATAFPKNANVAMTTALAGIGPELTQITLVADPNATTNRHEISASGAFGDLEVNIANNPLPSNPKTSAMAALNLVRAIQNRVTAIHI